jgi:membrane-associated phospholipid phosphatase
MGGRGNHGASAGKPKSRSAERKAAYLLVEGSLSAEVVTQLLKTLIHRPRPEVFFGLVPTETYSFPNGH